MRRVILMLGLLVCMLVCGSVTGKVVASDKSSKESAPSDVAHIQAALQAITSYIYQNKNKKILFDISGASEAGVSEEYIELGEELVVLSNSVVSRKRIKKERFERFAPYFSYIANNGVPVNAKEKRVYKHCGDKENPAPCPPRVWSRSFPSRQAVVDYLFKEGYHKTPRYCSSFNPFEDNENDYTKWVNAGCNFGAFRPQALIVTTGTVWGFRTQSPEPNPEIYNYDWPHWWWGSYVLWWHKNYC